MLGFRTGSNDTKQVGTVEVGVVSVLDEERVLDRLVSFVRRCSVDRPCHGRGFVSYWGAGKEECSPSHDEDAPLI